MCSDTCSPTYAERLISSSREHEWPSLSTGCFWHSCPVHRTWPKQNDEYWRTKIERNVERDKDTDWRLLQAGWHVLRFWAHEDPMTAATQIAATVKRRRHRHAGIVLVRKWPLIWQTLED